MITPATCPFTNRCTDHARPQGLEHARGPLNARLLSLRHSSLGWRASPLTRSGQIVSQGCLVHDQQKERIPGQRHDLNKCTLQDPYVWMFPKPLTNRYTNL
jgi:hypothetical protein